MMTTMTTASPSTPALLVLADGLVLRGEAFGASGTAIGEVVFNTGMTGYQEVMTDPSYSGQLVTFTYPELGNTGVNAADQEADAPQVRGVIARQLAPQPSSWRSEGTLESWLQRHNVVGISGIDSRALVRHLREGGAINGAISSDGSTPQQLLERVRSAPSMAGLNLAERVSTPTPYDWTSLCSAGFDQRPQPSPERPYKVVAIDFGIKRAILERLVAHGCAITVLASPWRVAWWSRRICRCSASAWVTRSSAWLSAAAPTSSATATAASTTPVAAPVWWRSPARTTASPSMPRPCRSTRWR